MNALDELIYAPDTESEDERDEARIDLEHALYS